MVMIYPIILAGGMGTRLWPLSREEYPKQCLPLNDEHWSLLQQTLLRTQGLQDCAPITVICHEQHRFLVAEQCLQTGVKHFPILLEPEARNTAAAIASAVAFLLAQDSVKADKDAVFCCLPADHAIEQSDAFITSLNQAVQLAREYSQSLLTLGIEPTSAHTGYGYIQAGEPVSTEEYPKAGFKVQHFKEKPDAQTAQSYLEQGNYYWNAGIFMGTACAWQSAFTVYQPELWQHAKNTLQQAQADLDFLRLSSEQYSLLPCMPFDVAIMEQLSNAFMVSLDAGWSDLGEWQALWQQSKKDEWGNHIHGDGLLLNSSNNYVRSERLVAGVGLENLIVVDTDDALLVADRSQSQHIKKLVDKLSEQGRSEHLHHQREYRPWGYFQSMDVGKGFKVKRLFVKPGHGLSLQSHQHRSEHWVVVSGTATVTRGEQSFTLVANESTYIPSTVTHSLRNEQGHPLEVIEVQTGKYLGEDDIKRFSDRYGRA
ncbi:bifunctional protein [Oceanobacter sp. RED65]|uniref:mannose-1-phosphate guanylyltransferase n=2 Tax=Bermanella marisrubri TaxID=207949 RepID=Q1N4C1_9GAMM|nr:bifunctional protein [Oceanobacter sp. RED65] [Bermanella marisrubri]